MLAGSSVGSSTPSHSSSGRAGVRQKFRRGPIAEGFAHHITIRHLFARRSIRDYMHH
jgi:hypothetical protein